MTRRQRHQLLYDPHRARASQWKRYLVYALLIILLVLSTITADLIIGEVLIRRDISVIATVNSREEVLDRLGPPDSSGRWSGTYGEGDFMAYTYPHIWDSVMPIGPPRVLFVHFRAREPNIWEVSTQNSFSNATRTIERRGADHRADTRPLNR